jgi:hypothetical protein
LLIECLRLGARPNERLRAAGPDGLRLRCWASLPRPRWCVSGARVAPGTDRRMAAIIAEKHAPGMGGGDPARFATPMGGVGV